MKNKINTKFILKYLALFFLTLVIANSEVKGLSPFLFALFFACVFVGLDEKLLSVFTLVSAMVVTPTLENFYIAITVIAVGLIMYLLFTFTANVHIL